jgi:Cu-Zn family superoxide dismutase
MRNVKQGLLYLCIAAAILILSGCQTEKEVMPKEARISEAAAVLYPVGDDSVSGIVRFSLVEGGIKIVADVSGLEPGRHGFHIHEFGDCSAADAASAGGHFNPENMPHGSPTAAERHVGDLGNIEADVSGKAHLERIDTRISFAGERSIIGRAVVVHAGEDDLTSQPTGKAGPRVACGVIAITREE